MFSLSGKTRLLTPIYYLDGLGNFAPMKELLGSSFEPLVMNRSEAVLDSPKKEFSDALA